MLEVVQRIPILAIQGDYGSTSLVGSSGSAPPSAQEKSQGIKDGHLLVVHGEHNLVSQAPRVVGDSNRYNKKKYIKNRAKEFIGGVDPIRAKNWIINK